MTTTEINNRLDLFNCSEDLVKEIHNLISKEYSKIEDKIEKMHIKINKMFHENAKFCSFNENDIKPEYHTLVPNDDILGISEGIFFSHH